MLSRRSFLGFLASLIPLGCDPGSQPNPDNSTKVSRRAGGPDPVTLEHIKLNEIIWPAEHPFRADWKDVTQLEADIKKHGLLNPIYIREARGGYEVINGFLRTQACLDLHWDTIPAWVTHMTDKEVNVARSYM